MSVKASQFNCSASMRANFVHLTRKLISNIVRGAFSKGKSVNNSSCFVWKVYLLKCGWTTFLTDFRFIKKLSFILVFNLENGTVFGIGEEKWKSLLNKRSIRQRCSCFVFFDSLPICQRKIPKWASERLSRNWKLIWARQIGFWRRPLEIKPELLFRGDGYLCRWQLQSIKHKSMHNHQHHRTDNG